MLGQDKGAVSVDTTQILKYHRCQALQQKGKLGAGLQKNDRFTACSATAIGLVIGTHGGFLHLLSLKGGIVKTFRPHDRPINDISVDSTGQSIACCSDNGSVVVYSLDVNEDREAVVHFSEPVKAVCIEDDNSKRDKSFIIGSQCPSLHSFPFFARPNSHKKMKSTNQTQEAFRDSLFTTALCGLPKKM